jgi:hypothetical protein
VVALGVDLPLLRQAVRVLRLKQVDADPVVEQPARNHVHMSSGEVEEVESKHRIKLIRSSNSNFIYLYIPRAVEVERARAPDAHEPEHLGVEPQRRLQRPAHDADVVQRRQRQNAAAARRRRVHHPLLSFL